MSHTHSISAEDLRRLTRWTNKYGLVYRGFRLGPSTTENTFTREDARKSPEELGSIRRVVWGIADDEVIGAASSLDEAKQTVDLICRRLGLKRRCNGLGTGAS